MSKTINIVKILIIGDPMVGKSSLSQNFVEETYDDSYSITIGVEYKLKIIEIDNVIFRLHIWDTAGQERFKSIVSTYYRGAHGILICYDTTNFESFKNVETWLRDIDAQIKSNICKVLVGTKCDNIKNRIVSLSDAKAYANSVNMPHFETSSKKSIGIQDVFEYIVRHIKQQIDELELESCSDKIELVDLNIKQQQKRKCC